MKGEVSENEVFTKVAESTGNSSGNHVPAVKIKLSVRIDLSMAVYTVLTLIILETKYLRDEELLNNPSIAVLQFSWRKKMLGACRVMYSQGAWRIVNSPKQT